MKIKKMPVEQFQEVLKRKWRRVKLEGNAIPKFLKNMPEEILHSVYASGDTIIGDSYSDKVIPSGDLIGGIDVYRKAVDGKCDFKKDWYKVISLRGSKTMLLIKGPIKQKDNHYFWDKIPEGFEGAEILAVPRKK